MIKMQLSQAALKKDLEMVEQKFTLYTKLIQHEALEAQVKTMTPLALYQ